MGDDPTAWEGQVLPIASFASSVRSADPRPNPRFDWLARIRQTDCTHTSACIDAILQTLVTTGMARRVTGGGG